MKNGEMSFRHPHVPAGAKLPIAHSHDAYEETIYGLRGVMTFTIEGTPHDIGPGDAVCIPRGAAHRFDNHGDVDDGGELPKVVRPEDAGADDRKRC